MVDRSSCMVMLGGGSAFVLALALQGSLVAQVSSAVATVSSPAAVTATIKPADEQGIAAQSRQVIITVTGFRPPQAGAVQAIVKVERQGGQAEQEIGRFGMFPNAEFHASDVSKAQRFSIPLPKDLSGSGPLKFHVYLAPLRGDGTGAVLELSGAELR
jgi:hypothetical protein